MALRRSPKMKRDDYTNEEKIKYYELVLVKSVRKAAFAEKRLKSLRSKVAEPQKVFATDEEIEALRKLLKKGGG